MAPTYAQSKRRDELMIEVAETVSGKGGRPAAQALLAAALERGEITERQARNIAKFAAAAWRIRTNPIRTQLIQDGTGRFIGEAAPQPDGTWRARPYGPEYAQGSVIVPDLTAAERHILQACRQLADSSRRSGA